MREQKQLKKYLIEDAANEAETSRLHESAKHFFKTIIKIKRQTKLQRCKPDAAD